MVTRLIDASEKGRRSVPPPELQALRARKSISDAVFRSEWRRTHPVKVFSPEEIAELNKALVVR